MKTKQIKPGQKVVSWKGIFGEMGIVTDIAKGSDGIWYKVKLEGGRGFVWDRRKSLQIV